MRPVSFLNALDHERILRAIREAEAGSSGEVRVHVASGEATDAQAAAAAEFERLGMTRTERRNGILFFVAPRSRSFAVLGDRGIHEKCGPAFWSDIAAAMEADFREGRFTDGIVKGVARAGEALARHFPREAGRTDVNELPDEVSED
jgi:uncharacterized membrane protein